MSKRGLAAIKAIPSFSSAALDRFWSQVGKGDCCWVWTGATNREGYGRFYACRDSFLAHRVAWSITKGDVPQDKLVCHHCDNPKCVNPEHLFLGTNHDNMQDMTAKGRHPKLQKTHCPHGHEYTPENTVLRGANQRRCLTCRREGHRAKSLARYGRLNPSNKSKTHCPHGHPYEGENLIIGYRNGSPFRGCRACKKARDRNSRGPLKEAL